MTHKGSLSNLCFCNVFMFPLKRLSLSSLTVIKYWNLSILIFKNNVFNCLRIPCVNKKTSAFLLQNVLTFKNSYCFEIHNIVFNPFFGQ